MFPKEDFPIFSERIGYIYLDSAATTLKPKSVIDAVVKYYSCDYATVHRGIYPRAVAVTEEYEEVRASVAQFIHAKAPSEIVFTKGTTESINLVANSFGKAFVQAGDEIVVSAMEHHANLIPWQQMAKERGATLLTLPMNELGALDLDALEKLLSKKTKLVAVTHISNALGVKNEISKIIEMAHLVGAKVLIDAAQSAASIPIDVQALDADFLVFSGHKLYGPTGVGVLYGKEALLSQMPPYQTGGEMVQEVFLERATFQDPPLRFEAGTPPISGVLGLGEALRYLTKHPKRETTALVEKLLLYLRKKKEITILADALPRGSIVTFTVKGVHPLDLGTFLGLKGVAVRTGHLCAQPALRHFHLSSAIRVSLAPYNDEKDLDLFFSALEQSLLLVSK